MHTSIKKDGEIKHSASIRYSIYNSKLLSLKISFDNYRINDSIFFMLNGLDEKVTIDFNFL